MFEVQSTGEKSKVAAELPVICATVTLGRCIGVRNWDSRITVRPQATPITSVSPSRFSSTRAPRWPISGS